MFYNNSFTKDKVSLTEAARTIPEPEISWRKVSGISFAVSQITGTFDFTHN